MFCSRKGNGIPITCTATSQKWTGQPIHLAGSKNPLTLGMGNVNFGYLISKKYNYAFHELHKQLENQVILVQKLVS